MTKDKLVEISFNIIALAGSAKAQYILAIDLAKKGKYEKAKNELKKGNEFLGQSHQYHYEVIQEEANEKNVPISTLFIHAEDQFLTTDLLSTLAEKMVEMYEVINEK